MVLFEKNQKSIFEELENYIMLNYGQVIHKIIQRGNRNMATVSKDVTLYGFWASSGTFYSLAPRLATIQRSKLELIVGNLKKATWRVRAALVYKNINYDEVSINIVGRDESWVDYQKKINPMGFVPSGFVSNWSPEVILGHLR